MTRLDRIRWSATNKDGKEEGTAGLDIDVGIQKLCAIEKWRRFGFLHFLRRVSSVMADLKELYEKSQTTQTINQMEFTEGESANFKKAFDDPEFRKMFTEYMDEIQDPNNRQETEDYIKQLEGEQKVPQGKELVRPTACFVAKTYKMLNGIKGDKVFVNIVSSESIMTPSKTSTPEGDTWSLPYSLGPPHMEKDKNESNVACFDCCYHPAAIRQMDLNKRFRDSLVITAIEGVEEAYKRQKQDTKMSREYHVLKGVSYKQGLIPAMLVDTAAKDQEWNQNGTKDVNSKTTQVVKKVVQEDIKESAVTEIGDAQKVTPDEPAISDRVDGDAGKVADTIMNEPKQKQKQSDEQKSSLTTKTQAIKKGFLTNAKSTIYPESVSAKTKKSTLSGQFAPIILPGRARETPSAVNGVDRNVVDGAGSLVQELTEKELLQLKKTGTLKSPAHISNTASTLAPVSVSPVSSAIGLTERSTIGSSSSDCNSSVLSSTISNTTSSSAGTVQTPQVAANIVSTCGKCPIYSLIERGIVSMGDFESLKAKVASNRPAELVCKITVPLVTKPSLMILDVAERLLKFSYMDTYELSVILPYPVFDKKGVAKYDKVAKTLTITMPVQPPVQPSVAINSPFISTLSGADTDNNNVESVDSVTNETSETFQVLGDDEGNLAPSQRARREKVEEEKKKKSNSRWVEEGIQDPREESRMRSEELRKEIEAKVEESRLMFASVDGTSASLSALNPTVVTSKTIVVDSITNKEYIASGTFLGKKEGYLFQKGSQGQGYYLDLGARSALTTVNAVPPPKVISSNAPTSSSTSLSIPAVAVAKSEEKATDVTTSTSTSTISACTSLSQSPLTSSSSLRVCRYEYKQTKQAIAVLVHVPHILLHTAKVSFSDYTVDVLFQAADPGSDSTETEEVRVNPTISSSPVTARITSDNTIINSSIPIAKNGNAGIVGNNCETVMYGFQFVSTGILEISHCKYDIASKNMVIVLAKKEEGYWEDSESDEFKILRLVPLPEGTGNQEEKKTMDPELVCFNRIQKDIDNNREDADRKNSQLIEQLDNMKFSTPVLFDLD